MKKTLILIASVMALTAGPSFALTAQQDKMKTCNDDAKTKSIHTISGRMMQKIIRFMRRFVHRFIHRL
jgi:hypothetical protein